jgi:hypothetical protein
MRTLRSVDSVRAALAAALGLTALSCGSSANTDVGSPKASGDTGRMAEDGTPHSPDATSSDETSSRDVSSSMDGVSSSDGVTNDATHPGDGAADGAAGGEEYDVSTAGCSPLIIGGRDTGYLTCSGQLQRRAIVDCPNLIAQTAPLCTNDAASTNCHVDQDCTGMPFGTCRDSPSAVGCYCDYGCIRDSDCTPGNICVCGDPIGHCEIAYCNAGTCAGGFACAEYNDHCRFAFACQSAADRCESGGDCDAGVCRLGLDGGGSQCAPLPYCGTGRPFLVAGKPRLPAIASADAWRVATVTPDVRALSSALRAELARQWTATARMEHASIAAFARFALQLLALGAPPELLFDAQRAMADETAHAQLAFSLASAFAGRALGPGPLAIDAALDETSLHELVVTTFAEGCIGETAAAVEATEAAALARDPTMRAALERIAADETRHAELAWRTVAWALRQAGDSAADLVRGCIARAEIEARDLPAETQERNDERLAAYGVLGVGHKRRLRRDVLTEIVLPSARALHRSTQSTRPWSVEPASNRRLYGRA